MSGVVELTGWDEECAMRLPMRWLLGSLSILVAGSFLILASESRANVGRQTSHVEADADALALALQAEHAAERAREAAADATLQQIVADPASGALTFTFASTGAAQEIHIRVPASATGTDEWLVLWDT